MDLAQRMIIASMLEVIHISSFTLKKRENPPREVNLILGGFFFREWE